MAKWEKAGESWWMVAMEIEITNGAYVVESRPAIKHTITYLLNFMHNNMMTFRPGSYAGRVHSSAGLANPVKIISLILDVFMQYCNFCQYHKTRMIEEDEEEKRKTFLKSFIAYIFFL